MDETWNAAKQSQREVDFNEDFSEVIGWFQKLAKANLSSVQMSVPYLHDALTTILMIDYSLHTADFITSSIGQKVNKKTFGIMSRKRKQLTKWFESENSKVSNFNFDFRKFNAIWRKMNVKNYNDFKEYIK